MAAIDQIGKRSVLTCPQCNGVMWEIAEDEDLHFRCHVGHAYSAEAMSVWQDDNLRRALGSALRALDERVAMIEKMTEQASARGHNQTTAHWVQKREEAQQEAEVIRKAFQTGASY